MDKVYNAPIMSSKDVRELLEILQINNASTMKEFMLVIDQVRSMEKQLNMAIKELAAMRLELAEAKKNNHPSKNAIQTAVIAMHSQVSVLREKMAALKATIISSCRDTIAAFRDRGVTALDNIARFFKIKPVFENIRDYLEKSIRNEDRAILKIEAISAEYHQVGLHVKNMGRVARGKEAAQVAKPAGKLAAAISLPIRIERNCFASIKKSAEAAINAMSRLEEKAMERQQPIRETLENIKKKIELEIPERTTPERTRKIEHAR